MASLRLGFVILLVLALTLIGCSQNKVPIKERVTDNSDTKTNEKTFEKVNKPRKIPYLNAPSQVIFLSGKGAKIKINSSDKIFILYGKHSENFDLSLNGDMLYVNGVGDGYTIVGAENEYGYYFSKIWLNSLKDGFAIIPSEKGVPFIKAGETGTYRIKVVSIGNFSDKVSLKVESSTKILEVGVSPSSGVPPFEAEVNIRAKGYVGDGHYIKITGTGGGKESVSYLKINNPVKKNSGILSGLLKIIYAITFPIRLALGITLGTISGITTASLLLPVSITTFSPDFILGSFETGKVVGFAVTEKFLREYSPTPFSAVTINENKMSGVGTIAIGDKFQLILPFVEFKPIIGKEYHIPIYVTGHGSVSIDVSNPDAVEAKLKQKSGNAPFETELIIVAKKEPVKKGIIFKKKVPYTILLNVTSDGKAYKLYRLYLMPVRKDYDVSLSSNIVYVEKGKYATVKAVVVRNNMFSPEIYRIPIKAPNGFDVFVERNNEKTPFKTNITLYAGNIKNGVYLIGIGDETLKVIVGQNGIGFETTDTEISQGGEGLVEVNVYSTDKIAENVTFELPLNHTVEKTSPYNYILRITANKYQPPKTYKGTIYLDDIKGEFNITVVGKPVILQYNQTVSLKKGETKKIDIDLISAGYKGKIDLTFTASEGYVVSPKMIKADVPGKISIDVKRVSDTSGYVDFNGYVDYDGSGYYISGRILLYAG